MSLLYHRGWSRDTIRNMHETFEHTADLGLRIRTAGLEALFEEAAQALFSAIVEDLGTIQPREKFVISKEGDDREYLLFDWLNELLYLFDSNHWLFGRFEVQIQNGRLSGTAWGEPLDRNRHLSSHEVKAITYHGLKVEQTGDGWLAEVIVDI